MTDEEKKTVVQEVLNQIKTDSQSVDELETATSLDSVNSLPAMQGEKVVRVPVSLLAKPAEDAAKRANAAAATADDAQSGAKGTNRPRRHSGRIIESGRNCGTAGQRRGRCGFRRGTHGQQFGHACRCGHGKAE